MFAKIGPLELGIILLIVIMIFGLGKLPQVSSALGNSIRAFKHSRTGDDEEKGTLRLTKRAIARKMTSAKTSIDMKTQSA